jgi:crotonobetainyl-CoA:carnitine CoA-transferase CaiB-like acyl-CoA transferase
MGLEYPDEVDAVLHPWFQSRTRSEIFALCRRHHVPFSPVRTLDEVAACEQLAARGFFVDTPLGADGEVMRMPGAPELLSATPWVTGAAPRLGEHTAQVLAGIGAGDAAQLERVS